MTRAKQPRQIRQMTVAQFEAMFPDEDACKAYLAARRWPDGVHCPRCGNPMAPGYAAWQGLMNWQVQPVKIIGIHKTGGALGESIVPMTWAVTSFLAGFRCPVCRILLLEYPTPPSK